MLHLFAALVERERQLISERTKTGLAVARARGVNLGSSRLNPGNAEGVAAKRLARTERLTGRLTLLTCSAWLVLYVSRHSRI